MRLRCAPRRQRAAYPRRRGASRCGRRPGWRVVLRRIAHRRAGTRGLDAPAAGRHVRRGRLRRERPGLLEASTIAACRPVRPGTAPVACSTQHRCTWRQRRRASCLDDGRGHCGQAVLHPRRSRGARTPRVCRRTAALPARSVSDDVRVAAVDDPAVRRLLDGGGVQRLLPAQPRRRAERPVGRVRPRHASRLRLGQRARRRRRRQGGCRDRFGRGHEDPLRSDPARPDVGLDDHERCGAADHGVLHRRGRGAGRAAGETDGDDPERHPQGVHGPQHVHLRPRTVDADRRRHLQVLLGTDAAVQLHLDQRVSHAGSGSDGRPRARVHARRWARVHPDRAGSRTGHRRLRAAPQLLLGDRHAPLHGDRQAAGGPGAVGAPRARLRPEEPEVDGAADALADVGVEPHRAGRVQQRHAHVRRGDGRRARPHAIAAHQRARRGDRAADGLLGADRAQYPDLPAAGDGDHARSSIRGPAATTWRDSRTS